MSSSSNFQVCSCNEVDCYYCDLSDPFVTASSEGPYMSDETMKELQWAEEQQKHDKQSSQALTERIEFIAS